MASIQFRKVVKSFGRTQVIRGVDLDIEDGEFCVFVGPSGCGKSTMLRLIAGLEDITSGELLIDGERMNERAPSKRGVAIVFQSYALYPHMNAYQNMAFGLKLAGKGKGKGKGKDRPGKQEVDRRVREAARILQIEDLLDRLPKQMSGGQRQRVAIGRAITRQPRVFLFDEPLSNLDAGLRVRTRIEIAKLHTRLGTTMVYVTHDQVEAMTLADKIVILDKGRIAQVGTPLALYHKPQNLFVAGFIGSPRMNFLAVQGASGGDPAADSAADSAADPAADSVDGASGSRVTLRGGRQVAVPIAEVGGGDAILGIRPEHVTRVTGSDPSAAGEEDGADGAGALEGEVQLIEHLGDGSLIYVSTEYSDDPLAIKEDGDVALSPGETIRFRFPRVSCHLFAGALGDGEPAIDQKALPRLVERSHPDGRE